MFEGMLLMMVEKHVTHQARQITIGIIKHLTSLSEARSNNSGKVFPNNLTELSDWVMMELSCSLWVSDTF